MIEGEMSHVYKRNYLENDPQEFRPDPWTKN